MYILNIIYIINISWIVFMYIYIYLYHSFPLHPGQITNRLMVCYRWQVVPMRDGDACWPSTDCHGLICDDCDVLSLHLEEKFLICGNVLSSVCLLRYIPYWFIEIPWNLSISTAALPWFLGLPFQEASIK